MNDKSNNSEIDFNDLFEVEELNNAFEQFFDALIAIQAPQEYVSNMVRGVDIGGDDD